MSRNSAADEAGAATPLNQRIALTFKEAGLLVGVSESTIRRAVASSELIAVQIGSRPRVRRSDLDEWLDASPYVPAA